MKRMIAVFSLGLILFSGIQTVSAQQQKVDEELPPEQVRELVYQLFSPLPAVRAVALDLIRARGKPDVAAALIQLLRFANDDGRMVAVLEAVTGATPGRDWNDWMMWQEDHPEIKPFEGFAKLKADIMAQIDENFRLFLQEDVKHSIRLEEITWGGVLKDGIPALTNPKLITPKEATYLTPDELVFGVAINGDVRAYPLRMLDWHEMFNDVIGGVPVALAYCTLCGSGILFETKLEGRDKHFVFGSSGFLYRSNKLMYDKETNSLWNQFTGKPVVGTLTESGIELKVRPVAISTWKKWLARHPGTKVLSLDTGFRRDYSPGRPYADYFNSPDLMFPALVKDRRLKPKDYIYAIRTAEAEKAWRLSAFTGGKVIHDKLGDKPVVLIGDAATRTVRAYAAGGSTFGIGKRRDDEILTLADGEGGVWTVTEDALEGPGGKRLDRLPGHIGYWFAWQNFRAGKPLAARQ